MTDNEIIKALECCIKECDYEHCPYYVNDRYECGDNFNKDILDLINRQKAEIERLERHTEMYHEVRAEAVKEFAERLKTEFSQYQREYRNVLNDEGACAMIIAKKGVDNLVKETVGEG